MKNDFCKQVKLKFLLVFALFCTSYSLAQQVPTVIPPSPNAANLGQYINTPMGLYTGTPQISVPIWTINDGKLTVPISLNYKAGGVKVSEFASTCGLGWVLNAGGAVSRSVVGLTDETPGSGYLYSPYPYADPGNHPDHSYLFSLAKEEVDAQPDLFNYSLPNLSGRFVFDKSQAIHEIPRENIQIVPGAPYTESLDNNTGYGALATYFRNWSITDNKGNIYKFEAVEKAVTLSREYSEIGNGIWHPVSRGVNCWYLTQIISPTGNTINFNYSTVDLDYDVPGTRSMYMKLDGNGIFVIPNSKTVSRQSVKTKQLSSIVYAGGTVEFVYDVTGRADLIGDNALQSIIIRDNSNNIVKQFSLQYQYLVGNSLVAYNSVSFSGENNRITSFESSLPVSFRRRLILQKIVERSNNGADLNNGYIFDYIHDYGLPNRASDLMDHWGFANHEDDPLAEHPTFTTLGGQYILTNKGVNILYNKQGSLYKVTYPTGGSAEYIYESNETNPGPLGTPEIIHGTLATLPFAHASYLTNETFDYEERQWQGGALTRHHYTSFTLNLTTTTIAIHLRNIPNPGVSTEPGYYIENVNNPNVKLWTGNTNGDYNLTLGPGQYRLYHHPSLALLANHNDPNYSLLYEASVEGSFQVPPANPGILLVGGLRVKTAKLYDPVTNTTITKNYTYNFPESSGQPLAAPVYVYTLPIFAPPMDDIQTYKVCTFNSVYPLSTTHGSYVGYSFVEEKTVNSDGIPIGKTEYIYKSPLDQPDVIYDAAPMEMNGRYFPSPFHPNPPVDSREWLRGFLATQNDYQYNNGTFSPVRTIINNYSKKLTLVSRGLQSLIDRANYNGGPGNYLFNYYDFYSGYIYPSQTREILYDGNNNITTITNVLFSDYSVLPVKKSITKSDGTVSSEYMTYPLEYSSGEPFIDNLVQKNIVSVPIETVKTTEDNFGNVKITGSSLSTYRTDNTLNDGVYSLAISNPVPLTSFKFSNVVMGQLPLPDNHTAYLPDSRYQLRLKFNSYDSRGNIVELQKANDIKKTYLWGYNKIYPVAEISGTDISTVSSYINQSVLDNPADDATLRNHLNNLRNIPNTLVTTYTYKPLVGMTSETDPAGRTIYYEYDAFNRLQHIRDRDNNILKKFDYNYQSPLENAPQWTATATTRCKPCPTNTSLTSNIGQIEEKDTNPLSASYNQTRWTDAGISSSCTVQADWQFTSTPIRCRIVNGENNGEQEREQMDMRPCSDSYGQTRWMPTGTNTTACPLPCNATNCSGIAFKCVNGGCEEGIRICTHSDPIGGGQYRIYFHYEFSDGSWSQDYSETGPFACGS